MKRLLMTIVLACVLSTTALAGEIPTVGGSTPASGDVVTPAGASLGTVNNLPLAATVVLNIISLIR